MTDQNCDLNIKADVVGSQPRTIPTECDLPSIILYSKDDCIGPRPQREKTREAIADRILLMLGAPQIPIELDQQQLALAVDDAMKRFERYAGTDYYEYYAFKTQPFVSRYRLPCDVGFINGVFYRTDGMGSGDFTERGIFEHADQVPFGRVGSWQGGTFYRPGWGHAGEFMLYRQYNEMYRKLSSAFGGYEIVGDNDIILYPNPTTVMTVIVHYMPRKRDWGETHEWIMDYSLALAKIMLGRIRSNLAQIPAPGGPIQLDGLTLLEEGKAEKEKLEEELVTRWSPPLPFTTY